MYWRALDGQEKQRSFRAKYYLISIILDKYSKQVKSHVESSMGALLVKYT